jgi:hypothetical protein
VSSSNSGISDQAKLGIAKQVGAISAVGGASPPPPTPQGPIETTGTFNTDFGVLTMMGNPATSGSYAFHDGRVTIMGHSGNTVDGDWEESSGDHKCVDGRYRGHFHWQFTQAGFTGSFGYCDDPANQGKWNGTRR